MCDFNDAYIVLTGKITATNPDDANYDRKLALKNNAPFFSSILKINNQLIEDTQDLDIIIQKATEKQHAFSGIIIETNQVLAIIMTTMQEQEYFTQLKIQKADYKTKLVGKLSDGEEELENIKIVVPLKHLSRFIFSLNILLINAEIELILRWSQNCVLTEKATRAECADVPAQGDNPALPAVDEINIPTDLKFNVTDCKMYVPVVTLEEEYENKLYEELKTGIIIDVTWNKYRSQVINQPATNNLNYLIDPTFNNVDCLFWISKMKKTDQVLKNITYILLK